jgi:small-conductance mechanosensitive channel
MIKVGRILTIIQWVLLAISAILVISLMVNIGEDTDPVMGSWINTNLIWTYILLALGAGIAVIAAILHTVTDAAAAKRSLISLGFLVVVALIAYLLASDAMPTFHGVEEYIADGTLTPRVSKLIGTGLYATYILLFLAVLGMVVSSVSRLFK